LKIIHICLASAYTEGMAYQDNILSDYNAENGHSVLIVSDCNKYYSGKLINTDEEELDLTDNKRLIRIKYNRIINKFISGKVRKAAKLKKILTEIKPDIMMFHSLCGWELLSVAKYKKMNPKVKLYVDSHEDKYNSGTNWLSLNILHRIFYKNIIKKALKYIEKVLYISLETKEFIKAHYKIPDDKLEFYPLGGIIIDKYKKQQYRKKVREELKVIDSDILLCHSGKMDYKKRTYELLLNFKKIKNNHIKLIIIGVLMDDVKEKVIKLIEEDNRVIYLGWKNSDELIEYIAASDLYVQPGSQSATMQNALCAGTPVLFENIKSYEVYIKGNAFAINEYNEMERIFNSICNNPKILREMSIKAYKLAKDILDYKKLARRIEN